MNASHWNNGRFYNPNAKAPLRGFRDLLHWLRHRQPGPWLGWIPLSPGPKRPERVGAGELRVTFVGHATIAVDRLRALVALSSTPEDFRILEEGIGRDVLPNQYASRTRDDDAIACRAGDGRH